MKSLSALLGCLVVMWGASALAGTRPLTDRQLDGITAGQVAVEPTAVDVQFNAGPIANQSVGTQQNFNNEFTNNRPPLPSLSQAAGSGGAILGDGSTATLRNTGLVRLSDSVQQNVQAMDVVNAAESSVANGVNVWRGNLAAKNPASVAPLLVNTQTNADQINLMAQDQSRSASVGEWGHFRANVDTSTSNTSSFMDSASVTKGRTDINIANIVTYGSDKGQGIAGAGTINNSIDAGQFKIETAPIDITLDLPKATLNITGASCMTTEGASCSASRNDSSSFTGSTAINSVPTSTLKNARAEYILGDNATLDVQLNNTVLLTDFVQQNAKVMNLVNAASSVVGNGVNVASTTGLSVAAGAVFNLNQTNVIVQHR